jgi:hypothetical protein
LDAAPFASTHQDPTMKKSLLLAALLALVLAGCSHQMRHRDGSSDPLNPRVFVVAGRGIAVNQEPIYIAPDAKNVTIVWQLPAESKYTFPNDGIEIRDGKEEFKCGFEGDNKRRYACVFANSKPGKWKYTIKVLDAGNALTPLDPSIVSAW